MKRANIADLKAHLSSYVDLVKSGEILIVCERNIPVAELRPISGKCAKPQRELGFLRGKIQYDSDAFAAMSDDELTEWHNRPLNSNEAP